MDKDITLVWAVTNKNYSYPRIIVSATQIKN